MDTFRKWLNKPKADDKSLLARFYHADRSLTAVASELDSFDGRAEPDRCSRLVTRLRQGQDKVLSITNLIMEELLGNERDARAFRAKFPEDVLQENLAGQLWFGAECLAAGSSILNREQESKDMRPLAQAVTKTLGTVRVLLREQCLRSNVPNSKTLHLDVNDTTTEQLYESLKIFDRLFAEFELRYVSAMVQVKTKQEYEMQELICVLFSETLQRALKVGLIEQEKVDAFDPALMFSIPRLAIIAGLVFYPNGPLNMDMSADQLSEMFRPFRTILTKIRDLLRTRTKDELYQLQKLLCTNEDINIKLPVGRSSIEAPISADQQNNNNQNESVSTEEKKTNNNNNNNENENNKDNSTTRGVVRQRAELPAGSNSNKALSKRNAYRYATRSPSVGSSISANSSIQPSTPHSSRSSSCSAVASDSFTSAVTDDNWSDDDDDDVPVEEEFPPCVDADDSDELSSVNANDEDDEDIVTADCASGYLIPNTNFGNLLQPQEIPLAGNFVASDDEFVAQLRALGVEDVDLPTSSGQQQMQQEQLETSQRLNRLRLSYSSEESDRQSTNSTETPTLSKNTNENGVLISSSSCDSCIEISAEDRKNHNHHHRHHRHHHHHHHHCYEHCQNHSGEVQHLHHHHHNHQRTRNYHSKNKKRHHSLDENAINAVSTTTTTAITTKSAEVEKSSKKSVRQTKDNTSSADGSTSSSLSDGEATETAHVLRTHGRMKFKSTENLQHRLFVCIAGVADQLQTNFASDLRQILRSVFLMNMPMTQDDIDDIPDKQRESELFEFRASENDVMQQRSGGSNQSIYSAEEANAELDNVFNNNNNNTNNNNSNSSNRSNRSSGSSSSSNNSTSSICSNNNRHSAIASIQRVHTLDGDHNNNNNNNNSSNYHNTPTLNQAGRSRSVGDQSNLEEATTSRHLSSFINDRRSSATPTQDFMSQQNQQQEQQQQQSNYQNRKSSISSNSPTPFSSANSSPVGSQNNSPLSERTAAAAATAARNNNNSSHSTSTTINTTSMNRRLSPPAWIPDDKAPRCMSCRTPFTAFRRRHHCRNCGGVFCGVCSNASTPLPKYGLTKAVRVCRDCYMREILTTASANATQYACTSERTMHATNTGTTTTAGGS